MNHQAKRATGAWEAYWQIFKEEDWVSKTTLLLPLAMLLITVVLFFLYVFFGIKLGHLLGLE